MTDSRRADPKTRRLAIIIVVVGVVAGTVVITVFDRYQTALQDWILADPALAAKRTRETLGLLLLAFLAPLVAFAVYLWRLGARAVRTQEYPPPGLPISRDTLLLRGADAVTRGQLLKMLAAFVAVAAAVMILLFWRLVGLLSIHAT